jgi:hypothetical protein
VQLLEPSASVYLYGSVATGTARTGTSDVDVLAVGLPPQDATALQQHLGARFATLCRGVEIAVAHTDDYRGEGDEAYGNRVFLKHYCIPLAGPDEAATLPLFPADARAARGFNGDIGRHHAAWLAALGDRTGRDAVQPEILGRRVARKTLLAVAGLASIHDNTWTTDRTVAARRWAEIKPAQADDLEALLRWSEATTSPEQRSLARVPAPDGIVQKVVEDFDACIGLWP